MSDRGVLCLCLSLYNCRYPRSTGQAPAQEMQDELCLGMEWPTSETLRTSWHFTLYSGILRSWVCSLRIRVVPLLNHDIGLDGNTISGLPF